MFKPRSLIVGAVLSLLIASPAMSHERGSHGRYGAGPCPGMMGDMMGHMGSGGMMGQRGMMGPGIGQQGQGTMGPGMGQQNQGMMGPGMGYHGMMGRGMGPGGYLDRDLSADDVKEILEHRLYHHGNDRLRVGKVEAKGDDLVVAEIETVDGSLVERLEVDRHTGRTRRVQ